MNENVSKNLRKLRLEKKLTQEQVAEKLGVSAQSVSRWETAASFPDIMLLPEISRLYGVLVDDLFKDDLQGYDKLSDRLVAVYYDTMRWEDFTAAVQEYERMEKEGTMEAWDYYKRTWLFGRMIYVSTKKILEDYDKTMELSKKNDPELYLDARDGKLIFQCSSTADGPQCVEEQLQVVKEHPEDSREWARLEGAYYNTKQYEECYRVAKEAITKFPEDSEHYCNAGDACKELGKYKEAYWYWEKRHELDPEKLDGLYGIAFCREELGEYDKAYEAWMRIVGILNEWKEEIDVKFPMRKAEECKAKMEKQE
ncbi:MAG: helix-turn-helix domain-containing protein [Lachnospiraceae bacterium]|nr:helix-turn-helix domain-containing protein [Lachnospiraceae bacterium]